MSVLCDLQWVTLLQAFALFPFVLSPSALLRRALSKDEWKKGESVFESFRYLIASNIQHKNQSLIIKLKGAWLRAIPMARIRFNRKSVHPSTSSGRTDLLLQSFDENLYPLSHIEPQCLCICGAYVCSQVIA